MPVLAALQWDVASTIGVNCDACPCSLQQLAMPVLAACRRNAPAQSKAADLAAVRHSARGPRSSSAPRGVAESSSPGQGRWYGVTSLELSCRASAQVGQVVHASVDLRSAEDFFRGSERRRWAAVPAATSRSRSRLAAKKRPSSRPPKTRGASAPGYRPRAPVGASNAWERGVNCNCPQPIKNSRWLRRNRRLAPRNNRPV